MKQVVRFSLFLLLLLLCNRGRAQQANILSVANVNGSLGGQVAVPILLSNTCNDIVAAQFRLTLPEGLTIDVNSAQFGGRTSTHTAVVQRNGNSYVVMIYAPDNSTVVGNAGQLLSIGLNIGKGLAPGGDYALRLSEVLLSNKAGENVMTSFNSGSLHITEVTDFVVTDVQPTKEGVLSPGDTFSVAWTVKNQGGLSSTGGWSEQISLVGSGRTQLLGTVFHEEPLSSGAAVSRQADLAIPLLPGIDGQAKIQVKLVPNADAGEMAEYQGNNSTQSTTLAPQAKREITVLLYRASSNSIIEPVRPSCDKRACEDHASISHSLPM